MTAETTHDVVIVGGGGSGLAAAIEARASARDVVLHSNLRDRRSRDTLKLLAATIRATASP